MAMNGRSSLGRKSSGRRTMAMPPMTSTLSSAMKVVMGRLTASFGRFIPALRDH